ncbi:uncharacterized protein [Rutidosis leptorrhynchoides]|uniref:uncharacterized protein n=1 Tax=Rutidosis leptorrhynchoides TaxID=125765 RepID=UPI003A992307
MQNKTKLVYVPKVSTTDHPKSGKCKSGGGQKDAGPSNEGIFVLNPFDALDDHDEFHVRDEDDDVIENQDETSVFIGSKKPSEGASTPGLGSHVSIAKLSDICNSVFPSWNSISNNNVCASGTRIIVGWNPSEVRLMIVAMTDQVINCVVKTVEDKCECFLSFVYADNYYIKRRQLWNCLQYHNASIGRKPWSILGDFNVSLDIEESIASSSSCTLAMREFWECVKSINMADVNHSGFCYTWNQRPNSSSGILKKIDRVMVNDIFINSFTNAYVIFQPYRISDHCPAVLRIPIEMEKKVRPFKFSNYIATRDDFKDKVRQRWSVDVPGHHIYRVVKRLHMLKKSMRKLMWNNGNVHENVLTREVLNVAQKDLDDQPSSSECRLRATAAFKVYNQAILDEESLLKQKEKIEWLRVGDGNTAYFHRVVKGRMNRNCIEALLDPNDVMVEGDLVPPLIISHYENFLGVATNCEEFCDPGSLFPNRISHQRSLDMVKPVNEVEIKEAMFGIGDSKSPGPDGYTSAFLKNHGIL